MNPGTDSGGLHRSGVAARLSGVAVATLRIWERRYSVIGPQLSAGRQRLYSTADIRRLKLIKQLVDLGHPIGTVASLGTEVLTGMQAATWALQDKRPGRAGADQSSTIAVALVGPLLVGEQFVMALSGGALRVVGRCADPAKAVAALDQVGADIAVIELSIISDADVELVASIKAACGAANAIVLYRFAPGNMVRRMRMAGYAVTRATADAAELETICLDLVRGPRGETGDLLALLQAARPRPPRFDEPALAALSGTSRMVDCECPRHVVELVINLGSFERYSAQCASRNPPDVLLRRELQRAAGLARSIMEQALEQVAIAEGIALTAPSASP